MAGLREAFAKLTTGAAKAPPRRVIIMALVVVVVVVSANRLGQRGIPGLYMLDDWKLSSPWPNPSAEQSHHVAGAY
jgi:hypothetical protein